MNIETEKTVDMLTCNSVSVVTCRFLIEGEQRSMIGDKHRCSYLNSVSGRNMLTENEPQTVVDAVFSMWGTEPTITEPEIPELEEETLGEASEETPEETE